MRPLSALTALLLVALATTAPSAAVASAATRDGPLPRVEEVGPVDPAPEGDAVEISPAVVEVVVPADRRVEVRHVVANGLELPLDLDVEVVVAQVDADGPAAGDTPSGEDDPVRLVAPVEQLRLQPGEGAHLISTAQADTGASGVLALTVTAADGSRAAALVVVAADDAPADPVLDLALAADGRPELTARAARPAVLDVRLRARSWLGAASDDTLVEVVVGEQPRPLPITAPASRLPGPVSAVAVAASPTLDPVVARAERFVRPPLPWLLGGVLVLVLAVLAVRWRRAERTEEPPGP
jgi:hypothetical protein